MKSFLAALRSLVLPYGQTTGARIIIDGVNGQILVYAANNVEVVRLDTDGVLTRDEFNELVTASLGGGQLMYSSILESQSGVISPASRSYMGADGDGTAAEQNIYYLTSTQPDAGEETRIGIVSAAKNGSIAPSIRITSSSGSDTDIEVDGEIVVYDPVAGREPWQAIPLQNLWVPRPGMYAPSFRRNALGQLEIVGSAWNGTTTNGTVVGLLPATHRPTGEHKLPIPFNNGGCYGLIVRTNGQLVISHNATAGSFNTISFDGTVPLTGPVVTP